MNLNPKLFDEDIRAQKIHLAVDSLIDQHADALIRHQVYDANILTAFLIEVNFEDVEVRGVEPLQPSFVDLVPHRRTPTSQLMITIKKFKDK